jgi:ankyrin repeat protein
MKTNVNQARPVIHSTIQSPEQSSTQVDTALPTTLVEEPAGVAIINTPPSDLVREVLLIVGPGNEKFDQSPVDGGSTMREQCLAAAKKGSENREELKLRIIGDGKTLITKEELDKLKGTLSPLTPVIILGHGIQKDGKHQIKINGSWQPTIDLSHYLQTELGIFVKHVYSCYDGYAEEEFINDKEFMSHPESQVSLTAGKKPGMASQINITVVDHIGYYAERLSKKETPPIFLEHFAHLIMTSTACVRLITPDISLHCPAYKGENVENEEISNARIQSIECKSIKKEENNQQLENEIKEKIQILVENKKIQFPKKDYPQSALFGRAYFGDKDAVARLLKSPGIDINKQGPSDGCTALFCAAEKGHVEIVQILLEAGADFNISSKKIQTPLYIACKNGHTNIIKLLIQKGAHLNTQSDDGSTALHVACVLQRIEVIVELLAAKADVQLLDKNGKYPMLMVLEKGNPKVVNLFLEVVKNDINQQDHNGRTPLHIACMRNDRVAGYMDSTGENSVMTMLLKQNANVHIQDNQGKTPIFYACVGGKFDKVGALLKSGADVNVQDKDGRTPLYHACKKGDKLMVENLLGVKNIEVNSTWEAISGDSEISDEIKKFVARLV